MHLRSPIISFHLLERWLHFKDRITTITHHTAPSTENALNGDCLKSVGWKIRPKYWVFFLRSADTSHVFTHALWMNRTQLFQTLNRKDLMVCPLKKKKRFIFTTCSQFVSLIFNDRIYRFINIYFHNCDKQ